MASTMRKGLAALVLGTAQALAWAADPAALFFDDFSDAELSGLQAGGWTLRSALGHPGLKGARWGAAQLRLLDDPVQAGNRLLRLKASTDGTAAGTAQAQLCHARKYLEGTYSARVRFSDTPVQGVDGDPVIQAFFAISPLRHDLDPEFSEVDWEYLPNGGWGSDKTRIYGISWQTVQIEPWRAFNAMHQREGSQDGWHVLLMQVTDGKVRLYLDGQFLGEHGGRNYPVAPMAINFNLWFSPGGLLGPEAGVRAYETDVDWVFHAKGQKLEPQQVDAAVQSLRQRGVKRLDSVPAAQPPLDSPCDM